MAEFKEGDALGLFDDATLAKWVAFYRKRLGASRVKVVAAGRIHNANRATLGMLQREADRRVQFAQFTTAKET
jgi:hypothetical protein